MEPLIVLVVVTLSLRAAGAAGIVGLRSWLAALRSGLAAMFVLTGVAHFIGLREDLIDMVPPALPEPGLLITVSGALELGGAAGLLWSRTAPRAASGLTLLLVAMFPANVYAALAGVTTAGADELVPRTLMQVVFVAATLAVARPYLRGFLRPTRPMIRLARPEDVAHLPDLERAAGAPFRIFDMAAIADDEPPSVNDLVAYQRAGRAWVATGDVDQPIAYLVIDVVDGAAHVEQVSAHPDYAGQRLGRGLLDTAEAWASQRSLTALTLTALSDVPWNAPYYFRLGFRVVPEDEWTPGLRRIRENEAAAGLDMWSRVVMRRPVPSEASAR